MNANARARRIPARGQLVAERIERFAEAQGTAGPLRIGRIRRDAYRRDLLPEVRSQLEGGSL